MEAHGDPQPLICGRGIHPLTSKYDGDPLANMQEIDNVALSVSEASMAAGFLVAWPVSPPFYPASRPAPNSHRDWESVDSSAAG